MSLPTIVMMPGDGIGRVVLTQAARVLDAVGFAGRYVHADVGWSCWIDEGNALPERTVDLLAEHKLGLFGAVTSKPKAEAAAALRPELRERGLTYFSPIIEMRQRFGLDVCVRPCRSIPGNPLNFVRRAADGTLEEPHVDVVVFRQNTEGIYCGVEWTGPPASVREALARHPRFRPFTDTPTEELAVTTRIFTRRACRRIVTAAFRHAERHGYRSVTVCEKPNILRETSGMMEDVAREVRMEFPSIEHRSANIDAQVMALTKSPEQCDVIVAGNLFGDILSDGYAGIVGGVAFAASGNIGDDVAIFEPAHGSAPKYADLDPPIVNPIGMILSAAMLLDHVGDAARAAKIRTAVDRAVADGSVRTFDMMRLAGGPGVVDRGAGTTTELTDAVIERLD